jgi:hypothetical protein
VDLLHTQMNIQVQLLLPVGCVGSCGAGWLVASLAASSSDGFVQQLQSGQCVIHVARLKNTMKMNTR